MFNRVVGAPPETTIVSSLIKFSEWAKQQEDDDFRKDFEANGKTVDFEDEPPPVRVPFEDPDRRTRNLWDAVQTSPEKINCNKSESLAAKPNYAVPASTENLSRNSDFANLELQVTNIWHHYTPISAPPVGETNFGKSEMEPKSEFLAIYKDNVFMPHSADMQNDLQFYDENVYFNRPLKHNQDVFLKSQLFNLNIAQEALLPIDYAWIRYIQAMKNIYRNTPTFEKHREAENEYKYFKHTPAKQKQVSDCCVFCRNNNEPPDFFESHLVRDCDGRTTCPKLRTYVCPICYATGDDAHTRRYCPQKSPVTLEDSLKAENNKFSPRRY